MAIHNETKVAGLEAQIVSRWHKLVSWLDAFEKASSFDPVAHIAATLQDTRQVVGRLESRVQALEVGVCQCADVASAEATQ